MPLPTRPLQTLCMMVLVCAVPALQSAAYSWDAPIPVVAADQGTAHWTKFLADQVNAAGLVDYQSAATDRHLLSFVAYVANTDPASLTDSEVRKAFWINAYNALAIYGVTLRLPKDENGPATFSVIDQPIDGLPANKGFFVGIRFMVGGHRLGLDDIEKKILLRQWDPVDASRRHWFEQVAPAQADARVHFALVCCAVGCPILRQEAYDANRLDEQLRDATRAFLADEDRSQFKVTEKSWAVSELIQWYQPDLINPEYANSGDSVLTFAAQNVQDGSLARSLRTDTWSISYFKYDWRLNHWRK